MAAQSTINPINNSLTYPSTKTIATKQHMAVWVYDPNAPAEPPFFGWTQLKIDAFDLVNNAAVINDNVVLLGYTLIEVRVADNPNELELSPSVLAILATIAKEIVIVACSAYEVKICADNIEGINACSDNIIDIAVCADHIDEIIDAPTQAHNAQLSAWIAEAEAMTSDSYATQPEDELVIEYISNGDGTFTQNPLSNTYSSFHYLKKNQGLQGGLHYVGEWDASDGVYPTTRPPEGTGDPLVLSDTFLITDGGSMLDDGVVYEIGDWMIYNTPGDWTKLESSNDWSDITNVPSNVQNAITDVELQAGLATKPTGSWSFDGTTLFISVV